MFLFSLRRYNARIPSITNIWSDSEQTTRSESCDLFSAEYNNIHPCLVSVLIHIEVRFVFQERFCWLNFLLLLFNSIFTRFVAEESDATMLSFSLSLSYFP